MKPFLGTCYNQYLFPIHNFNPVSLPHKPNSRLARPPLPLSLSLVLIDRAGDKIRCSLALHLLQLRCPTGGVQENLRHINLIFVKLNMAYIAHRVLTFFACFTALFISLSHSNTKKKRESKKGPPPPRCIAIHVSFNMRSSVPVVKFLRIWVVENHSYDE